MIDKDFGRSVNMSEIQIIKVLRRLESCLYDNNIHTSGWTAKIIKLGGI